MLVLLGVPWVFSAFGVIDDNDVAAVKLTEGVFQVVLFELQSMNVFDQELNMYNYFTD